MKKINLLVIVILLVIVGGCFSSENININDGTITLNEKIEVAKEEVELKIEGIVEGKYYIETIGDVYCNIYNETGEEISGLNLMNTLKSGYYIKTHNSGTIEIKSKEYVPLIELNEIKTVSGNKLFKIREGVSEDQYYIETTKDVCYGIYDESGDRVDFNLMDKLKPGYYIKTYNSGTIEIKSKDYTPLIGLNEIKTVSGDKLFKISEGISEGQYYIETTKDVIYGIYDESGNRVDSNLMDKLKSGYYIKIYNSGTIEIKSKDYTPLIGLNEIKTVSGKKSFKIREGVSEEQYYIETTKDVGYEIYDESGDRVDSNLMDKLKSGYYIKTYNSGTIEIKSKEYTPLIGLNEIKTVSGKKSFKIREGVSEEQYYIETTKDVFYEIYDESGNRVESAMNILKSGYYIKTYNSGTIEIKER
ncbi:hypothetical protein [Haliovirga abyssi]|uniref:Uncharacterized protein n=1 Tax=Haliovirga abyssi TaxID=2996794 RepID=A0AAU9DUY1_9FUSO|nr:hypothetical protein [Haliovirga abyssi]BDU49861.1 hypothetical protein HLVA_04300 [Haliovirga abyssi]